MTIFENNQLESVCFDKETRYKIGKVTYLVEAHFGSGDSVTDRVKQLLREQVQKAGNKDNLS